MGFIPKGTKQKIKTSYKTIYISDALVERINQIAGEYSTSFNNVVISMIEYCLEEDPQPPVRTPSAKKEEKA